MRAGFISVILLLNAVLLQAQRIQRTNEPSVAKYLLKDWELYLTKDKLSLHSGPGAPLHKTMNFANAKEFRDFNGVCWFRKIIKRDSAHLKEPLTLHFEIIGAAEVFLNKKKIIEMGRVGYSPLSETIISSNNEFAPVNLSAEKENELLIRFSHHQLDESYNSRGENIFGLNVYLKPASTAFKALRSEVVSTSVATLVMGFFLTLCFVHLVIYLLNRKEVANIYYSVFCFCAALFTFAFFADVFFKGVLILSYFHLCILVTPIFGFNFLPYMLRAIFKIPFPRFYHFISVFSLICISLFFLGFEYAPFSVMLYVLYGITESARVIVLAFKRKKAGVKIIGLGISAFVCFVLMLTLSAIFGGIHIENQILGFLFIIFFLLCVFSIPISITIYLAFSISRTSKSLAAKLHEVEELSARTIEQEKEKQQILEAQKETLERQVAERTAEISEQKKVIEEKNKDIIDSITYAKRIQSAMLPDERAFGAVFENSFVLYLPRDIVSGDFYCATQTKRGKLLVAADCTGHGVPGALMSMVGANIIQKLSNEGGVCDPAQLIEQLHIELRQALKQDQAGSVNRDGMDVAAVLITDNEIIYGGANRPMVWFDKENKMFELKPTKTAVGGSHIENVTVNKHTLAKENISGFYLFSDGFADQFGGEDGKKLMLSRFKTWLSEISLLSSEQQRTELEKRFIAWKKNTEQVDDVLVIGVSLAPVSGHSAESRRKAVLR